MFVEQDARSQIRVAHQVDARHLPVAEGCQKRQQSIPAARRDDEVHLPWFQSPDTVVL